jgi:hypothetical protein
MATTASGPSWRAARKGCSRDASLFNRDRRASIAVVLMGLLDLE